MKVCVYAICKNESKFVDKWVESMSEADKIYVLDTGSSDNTVELLKKYDNVVVEQKIITPWRFDVARNESLKLVPLDTDICVCTDLDELFVSGWRKELEKNWEKGITTKAHYTYNWRLDKFGNPDVYFYGEKIHIRNGYYWKHAVHEYVTIDSKEHHTYIPSIVLNHYPDNTKSRSNYLDLLEMSVKENPKDDRDVHYLGREYFVYKRYDDAIKTLKKHLKLDSNFKEERASSMKMIGLSYKAKNDIKQARQWLKKAIIECPNLRDSYVQRALLEYEQGNYKEIEKWAIKALSITEPHKEYVNDPEAWGSLPYDLISLSYFYQDKPDLAVYFVNEAIKLEPDNQRLINNKMIMENKKTTII